MTEKKQGISAFSESLRSVGEGSGALKIHSRADAANRVAVYGVRHVTVSPRSYIVWRTEVVQRFLIKETRPLEAFALRGLFCWGDIMKCGRQAHVRPRRLQAVYKRSAYYEALRIYKRKINLKGGGNTETDKNVNSNKYINGGK